MQTKKPQPNDKKRSVRIRDLKTHKNPRGGTTSDPSEDHKDNGRIATNHNEIFVAIES